MSSVIDHLQRMLNSRKGGTVTAPSYGIADFTNVGHDTIGGINDLAQSIRAGILEHEPRLTKVTVRALPREADLRLKFEIRAQIGDDRSGRSIRLSATVRPGGRVEVGG